MEGVASPWFRVGREVWCPRLLGWWAMAGGGGAAWRVEELSTADEAVGQLDSQFHGSMLIMYTRLRSGSGFKGQDAAGLEY